MAKLQNPNLPKLNFQRLISSATSGMAFPRLNLKSIGAASGMKPDFAGNEPKPIRFGSPSQHANASAGGGKSTPGATLISNLLDNFVSNGLGGSVLGAAFSGLGSLLGFGQSSAPPPLVRFSLPQTKAVDASIPKSRNYAVSNVISMASSPAPAGVVRSMSRINPIQTSASLAAPPTPSAMGPGRVGAGVNSGGAGHQFHIHVSALDTQSIVDRSGDIAKAVKAAMLHSNTLNDVVAEV